LQRAAAVLALIASAMTFLMLTGTGLFLLLVQNSGERLAGLLLALVGIAALVSTLALVFSDRSFGRGGNRWSGALAIVGACVPIAVLGACALAFSRLPLGSRIPAFDWSIFTAGILLLAGAMAVVYLGLQRMARPAPPRQAALPEQIRHAQLHLRAVLDPDEGRELDFDDEDIRVTRVDPVELPSLGRLRTRRG
jgi:hypothetical protein